MINYQNYLLNFVHAARRAVVAALLLLAGFATTANAQDAEEFSQQLEAMRQHMEQSGLTTEQLGQVEGILKGVATQAAKQEAVETAEFEKRTAGLGTAKLSVDGDFYEYRITKCTAGAARSGDFIIEAQQGPERREGTLTVRGDSHYNRVHVMAFGKTGDLETYIESPLPDFDGRRFKWAGEADSSYGPAQLQIDITCTGAQ